MDDNTNQGRCPCCRTKARGEEEYRSLVNRLSRIEGQVRGVKGMLERDAYCIDVINQVAAITAALNAFNKELLGNHIRTCVVEDIQNGHLEVVDDLLVTIQKLTK